MEEGGASAPPAQSTEQPVNAQTAANSKTSEPSNSAVAVSSQNSEAQGPSKASNTSQSEPSGAPPNKTAFNTRPWQQPAYSHFSLPSSPMPVSAASTSTSVSATATTRGAEVGVPASNPSLKVPSQQSQIKQPLQGVGTIPASSIWPTGIPTHQLRPSQPSLRPQAAAVQPQSQSWQTSSIQGKPPLPTTSVRPVQQRSYMPQQLHPGPTPAQPTSSSQRTPQPLTASQQTENQAINKQTVAHPPAVRGAGLGSQRANPAVNQGGLHSGAPNRPQSSDVEVPSNRIVSKRSIKDIAYQIDPSETLDPEVENILMDIAEDYLESVVTFGCSLAKHRKSSTLEAKDILLHVERNWCMALPGFGGDEIKTFKKPVVTDIHRERLAAVRNSIMAANKISGAPATGTGKTQKGLPTSSGHP